MTTEQRKLLKLSALNEDRRPCNTLQPADRKAFILFGGKPLRPGAAADKEGPHLEQMMKTHPFLTLAHLFPLFSLVNSLCMTYVEHI